MTYIPEQGDLIWLNFNPSSDKEIMQRRPAFVLSKKAFNQHTKMAIVAPITSTIRGIKLEVALPDKIQTAGAILVYQLRSMDFVQRKSAFIEKAPSNTINEVLFIAQLLVQ